MIADSLRFGVITFNKTAYVYVKSIISITNNKYWSPNFEI